MLAPPEWKTVSSYIIGWLTSLAWVATVATETLFAGLMLQGVVILNHPEYDAKPYHGTLITWAVICICVFVNVVIPNWLPRLEIFTMVFHIAGFFAILITLLVLTPDKGSNASVWMTSNNGGGFPTQGLSYCVGFIGNVSGKLRRVFVTTFLLTVASTLRSLLLSVRMHRFTWPRRWETRPGHCPRRSWEPC